MPSHRPIVVFSGGTAANHLVDIFEFVRKSKDCPLSYIIPISDNGGSSSELIRVFGGPGIGDVRSRLVRLIPPLSQGSSGFREREAIRALFNHRLSSTDSRTAKVQWGDVVDGTSALWKDVSSAKKELIRSFLNLVNAEITKRSRPPGSTFDFTSASVGNLFLTGARLFSGSFESAIYLLGSVCGIEDEHVKVIPSINSNFSHHIAAGLEDGSVVVGQNAISHPSPDIEVVQSMVAGVNGGEEGSGIDLRRRSSGLDHYYGDEHERREEAAEEEDANLPGTLPTLRTRNIKFNKDAHLNEDLPARIARIWYINPYGQEILPPANPRAIQAITNAQAIIYSIGSLYTSLVPSLVLRGVGDALRRNTTIGSSGIRTKILILNGCLDREVGPQPPQSNAHGIAFSAVDFVEAIVRAGEQSRGVAWDSEESRINTSGINTPDRPATDAPSTPQNPSRSPTPFLRTRPTLLSSKSENTLRTSSNKPTTLIPQHLFPTPLPASANPSRNPSPTPTPPDTDNPPRLTNQLDTITLHPHPIYTSYITHLIHLPNSSSTPHVDKDVLLRKYGIQCLKVYGRSAGDGQGMRYDPAALRGAIEAVLGPNAEREGEASGRDLVKGRAGMGVVGGVRVAEDEWSWRIRGLGRRNTVNE